MVKTCYVVLVVVNMANDLVATHKDRKHTNRPDAIFISLARSDGIWYKEMLINIGSGNGLALNRCQAITWTNVDLWIGPNGTNFCEN